MKTQKPYVRIQSNVTIRVTPGLQNLDVTNPDAHVPDRLKVSPTWPKAMIMIKQGAGIYPSEIVEWPTVKALEKDNVLTIGDFLDTADETVAKTKEELQENINIISPKKDYKNKEEKETENKSARLADIAGEEE